MVLGEPKFARTTIVPKDPNSEVDLVMQAIKVGLRDRVKEFFGTCGVLIPDKGTGVLKNATEAETIGLVFILLEQAGGHYQAAKQVAQARIR